MKITRYFLTLAAAAGILSACTKLDETRVLPIGDATSAVLHELPADIVITKDNQADEVTFTWDAADFGAQTEIRYAIYAEREDGVSIPIFTGITGTSYKFTKEMLNGKMSWTLEDGGLELPVNVASPVKFSIGATIGTGYEMIVSERRLTQITPTDAEKVYPNIWVIGDYCGWNHANAQWLYSFAKDEVNYEGVVDFGDKAKNGFKFTGVAGWDDTCNWGLENESTDPEPAQLTLFSSGGSKNIQVFSKRFYKMSFSKSTLVLKNEFSFDKIGVIGDASGGWGDADDKEMTFNPLKQRFWVDIDMAAGEFKLRADGAWALSWGTANNDGKLDGGNNIKAEAGKVRVYVYMNDAKDMRYELNAKAYGTPEEGGGGDVPEPPAPSFDWFYHGQSAAFPDWEAQGMTKDGDNYKITVTVEADYQFLFKNGDGSVWVGADQSLKNDGDLFKLTINAPFKISGDKVNASFPTAGTYDVWLFPADNRVVVSQKVADQWGLVGTVSGWGGRPDLYLAEEDGLLVRRGVELKANDEFKVRFNDAWDDAKNYGFENDGSIAIDTAMAVISSGGSKNMKMVAAGTYDIYFDLAGSKLYVLTPGKTPATI